MRSDKIKVTAIAIIGCALLFVALTQVIPMFIPTEPIVERVRAQVERITGENFIPGDRVTVSLLTGGKLVFDGVAIKNPPEATKNYFLRADKMVLHMGIMDLLFSSNPDIEYIELITPSIELEHFDEERNNWSFLFQGETVSQAAQGMRLMISNGEIIFTDHMDDYVRKLQGISGELSVKSGQMTIDMQALLDNSPAVLSSVCQFVEFKNLGSYDAECTTSLKHVTMDMNIKGRLAAKFGGIISKQTITAQASDIRLWGDALFGRGDSPFTSFYSKPMPLNFKAETYADAKESILNITEFHSGETTGKGSVTIKKPVDDKDSYINGNFIFDILNYDELALGFVESVGGENDPFRLKDGFNKAHAGELTISAKQIRFHEANLTDFSMQGQISAGALIVTQAKATAPKNGNILTLGRVIATKDGLEYEGLVEAYGDSLHDLSTMFGIAYDDLPAGIFTQFRTRFNIILRARSTTLSELRLVTGDRIQIAGGVNLYSETVPRLNATIAVRNLDFTPFEKHWLKDSTMRTAPDQQKYNPYAFAWLRDLNKKIQLQFEMDKFTMMGLEGAPSSFTLDIEGNKLELRNVNMELAGSKIQGNGKMTMRPGHLRPLIESQFNVSRINLGDMFMSAIWAERQKVADQGYQLPNLQDTVWSRDAINFYPLHYFDGMCELRIRQIDHEKFSVRNFKGVVKINDYQLTMKEGEMNLWGGDMKMDVTVDSEVVPGLNVSYYLMNAQVRDILESFVDFKNISGLISMSGRLGFNGLTFESWIDGINGHAALDARNVFVQEFNLPAIIRSITSLRSVSGLFNAIRLSFDTGSTRIGSINGTTYFSKGAMQTTRITFRSNESVGTIDGKFNLRRWTMDMAVNFGLITLAQTGYPFMVVGFDGPLEMPKRSLNVKSIEAFLAQKLR